MAAIYQWLPPNPTYLNYENVLLSTNEGWTMRYLGLNYEAREFTDLGGFPQSKNTSVVSDGKNVIVDSYGVQRGIDQFIWRGNAFTHVHSEAHLGPNAGRMMHLIDGKLIWAGCEAYNYGYRWSAYAEDPPYGLVLPRGVTASGSIGFYIGDIQRDNIDELEYGDAFFLGVQVGDAMQSYYIAGFESLTDSLAAVSFTQGSWLSGWNTRVGIFVAHEVTSTASNKTHIWTVENDGILTYKGVVIITSPILGVGIDPFGNLITCESGGGSDFHIRSYTLNVDTLTINLVQTETSTVSNVPNTSSTFYTSPITGRVFFCSTSDEVGLRIYEFNADATFTRILSLPTYYSFGASGYVGKPIHFLAEPLTIVPNGYAGIKEKLYEAWEMNEVGSVDRVGALNIAPLTPIPLTPTGTVNDVAGTIGRAASFAGAEKLSFAIPDRTTELRTVNTFSMCMEVVLDSKTADQCIVARGRSNWSTAITACPDFQLIYDFSTDLFCFDFLFGAVAATGTPVKYSVSAPIRPTVGQKYHIYIEYDKDTEQISIAIDNGGKTTTQLPIPAYLYTSTLVATLGFGARSTQGGQEAFLNGNIDQVFWFWDKLTTSEATWMYNAGSARAFSEL